METEGAPWLFALLTAAWFWWMANRANRTRTLWAVGGGAFGLVISTLILGLGRARSLPISDQHRSVTQLKWAIVAAVVIIIAGWVLTSGLHRHHLALWRRFRPASAAPSPSVPSVKPTTPSAKPATGKAQYPTDR
jgi:hypothetical protein